MHSSYLFAHKQLNFVSKLKLFCNFVELTNISNHLKAIIFINSMMRQRVA